MKKIHINYKSISLALCLTLGWSACNDSFLERAPRDAQSDASFWKTEEDATKFLIGTFRYLVQTENHTIMTDCYTDNAVPVHVSAEQGALSAGTATASNAHFLQLWNDAYSGIRRCLIYKENIDKVTMSADVKHSLTGEIKFLEAFFYATLVKYMGGVPILDHPLQLNETVPERKTEKEIYAYISRLLDEAATVLPIRRDKSAYGRPTKGAALALKARTAYYFHDYAVAEKASKEVIDLNTYKLYDSYESLFLPEHENNAEVIFDRQYMEKAPDRNLGSLIDQFFAPIVMGGWEALSPTQDLVDAYLCTDGKSIKESPLYNPEKPFENRDPRLSASILWDGQEIVDKKYIAQKEFGYSRTGYTMRKYINPKNDGQNEYGWTNFIFIRYAEVLLTYAEARNEQLGTPDEAVYDAVNKVRQRVKLPTLPNGLTKDQMREAIRLERRLEFTFEGMYLFDTRSWKTTEITVTKPVYGKRSTDKKPILIEKRKFNPERDYLWAIPLSEIDLSRGTLKQNPGY